MRLHSKLLLTLLPVSVVPALLISAALIDERRAHQEEMVLRDSAGAVALARVRIEASLESVRLALAVLNGRLPLTGGFEDELTLAHIDGAGLRVHYGSLPALAPAEVQEAIRETLADQRPEHATFLSGTGAGAPVLWVSRRHAATPGGYRIALRPLRGLGAALRAAPATARFAITNGAGRLLAELNGPAAPPLAAGAWTHMAGAAENGAWVRMDLAGRSYRVRAERLSPGPRLLVGVPTHALWDAAAPVAGGIVLLAAVAVAAFSLLAWWIIQIFLTTPIRLLGRAAEELGQGDMSAAIPVESRDELGELAEALRNMGRNLRQTNQQIRYFAYHDSLTKLPNRLMFSEFLKRALSHARRRRQMLGLLFLDLDDFKRINDTLGHAAGDHVLRELSVRLVKCLRAEDTIGRPEPADQESDTIARLGGDEFTILLPNLHAPYMAVSVAKRVLEAIAQPFTYRGHDLYVGASIGITIYPNDGKSAETLIKNADIAMYHAKQKGKNTYRYFRNAMNRTVVRSLRLENALRKAIERGELVLHYQPQVDTGSGRLLGVEALIRWQREGEGLTYPDGFILVAEETGLIVPMGEWVIRTACAHAAIWQAQGRSDLKVAVNVSGVQFLRRELPEMIAQAITDSGIPAPMLEVELTETTLLRAERAVGKMLPVIKELGITVTMDDFGTGYSSLSYLRRFPIDKLKIDRHFVSQMTTHAEDAAIVSAIIAMARSMNMPVTAEGVETSEQLALLRQQGCNLVQGYFVSRAVPVEAITGLLHLPSLFEMDPPVRSGDPHGLASP
ncbi:MAG: putative bifunctional diguanylate cyclase/phosphodiesterase [Gammaproteobacteria bacterium]